MVRRIKGTMGKNISQRHFHQQDYKRFAAKVKEETDTLQRWCREGKLQGGAGPATVGMELVVWLVDDSRKTVALS